MRGTDSVPSGLGALLALCSGDGIVTVLSVRMRRVTAPAIAASSRWRAC